MAISGANILVPCHVSKSLQLIWRLGTRRWNLWVPNAQIHCSDLTETRAPGPVFCLLLGVSSGTAGPITGKITSVTWPVNGQAEPELTQSKRQKQPWTAVPVMVTRLTSPALLHFHSNDKFKAVLSNIRLKLPTPTPTHPNAHARTHPSYLHHSLSPVSI